MLKNYLLAFFILFSANVITNVAQAETVPTYSPWQTQEDKKPQQPLKMQSNKPAKKAIKKHASIIEDLYTNRLNAPIKQFGYDIFTAGQPADTAPMGAVQDDFVLGAGDTLQISFTGGRIDQGTYKVDSSGMLNIKEFPPIPTMGRTITQLRRAVNTHLGALHNTQAYISLSSVRQIGVLVIGHVKNPGRKNLNAFHTVIDAISLAGGIQKDGSLRQIKLVRGGHSTIIDFYDLLMQGSADIDLRLQDGDRLIIPTIGATIAVSGAVKRPAIYELTKTRPKLSMNDLLEFSGGVLSAGKNRFIKLALTAQGQETTTQITNPKSKIFGNSTILNVSHGRDKRASTIELSGHTNAAGLYDLSKHKTLGSLLQNQTIIGDDIYPLIGIIKRWDAQQLTTRLISFPMRLVLNGKFDIKMQDNDKVILLSNTDISTVLSDSDYDTTTPTVADSNNDNLTNDEAIKSFLKERSIFVRGAVRMPGLYPIAQGITLDNILAVAGGMTLEANKQSIEITTKNLGTNHQQHGRSGTQRTTINLNETNPNTIELSAGDAVRVNQKYHKMDERTVLIIGEVNHPGNFDLLSGDKVSDLIARAGGVTDQAYPAGAIFSRESERRIEETRFRSSAHNMQRRLASAIEREKNPPNADQIEMVRQLADELANIEAVGRITVETDPTILSTKPELDMLLEKNDRIYIPKRPLNVRVSGDVLSPASLQFRKDKDPLDYIKEAGGFTYDADKNRTFVLYPDGSAQPLKVSKWNHNPIFIPPGSTIIVPRDPKPFDFIESAKEVGQILSNLAITAVFIDDIRD